MAGEVARDPEGQELAGSVGEELSCVVGRSQHDRLGVGGLVDHVDHGELVSDHRGLGGAGCHWSPPLLLAAAVAAPAAVLDEAARCFFSNRGKPPDAACSHQLE